MDQTRARPRRTYTNNERPGDDGQGAECSGGARDRAQLKMKETDDSQARVFINRSFNIELHQANDLRWESGARPVYSVLVPLRGTVKLSGTADVFTVSPKEIVLLNPGDLAELRGERVRLLLFSVSPSFMLESANGMGFRTVGTFPEFRARTALLSAQTGRVLGDIAAELQSEQTGKHRLLAVLMDQLIINLLRDYAILRVDPTLELSRFGLLDRRIRLAVEFMHSNIDREVPLREIASAAHLSAFHFARLFKKLTGLTPHNYLASLRISRARELLAESDLSITAVAHRVGFATSSHFTKAFRESTGLSPRRFREALVNIELD
jgi:AraC-like DNA-binding protein